MGKPLSILCVHGIGHQELDPDLESSWSDAILKALRTFDPAAVPTIDFLKYDELFDHAPLDAATYGEAMAKLMASAVVHEVGDVFAPSRDFGELPEKIRWTAGMIAQWSTEDGLRQRTRDAVLSALSRGDYDAVFAHSMGSLICYDAFARNPDAIAGKVFVTLGSQIGHPAVRGVFAGRIVMLSACDWYHLYNRDDHVFTWPLSIAAPNFRQVDTEFDIPNDWLNHAAPWYLGHTNAVATVWRDLAGATPAKAFVSVARGFLRAEQKPTRRALLVGINEYPDPAHRLEGCVNDVYLMSALLQENGFLPGEVRIVLNHRATAAGIESRLHWLLDGLRDGDERFLFYSGHGAQLPEYGPMQEPDHVDECLVPYDFDWTSARAITDKLFCELYAQLPYESRFVAVLDCCHSGGMTRDGMPRIRGLTAPDDIRHRAMKWDAGEGMWVARRFPPMHAQAADARRAAAYFGAAGATRRFGGGASLRTLARKQYVATRKAMGHEGPYLPVLLEACQENGLSYEYRNGATPYGAFTFCLVQALRAPRKARGALTYAELGASIAERLRSLDYRRHPISSARKRSSVARCSGRGPVPLRRRGRHPARRRAAQGDWPAAGALCRDAVSVFAAAGRVPEIAAKLRLQ